MAGLAAANALNNAGIRNIVIEGRDRIGGRLHTVDVGGIPIDLGASWIHDPDGGNPMTAFANAAGVAYTPADPTAQALSINYYDSISGTNLQSDLLAAFANYNLFTQTESHWLGKLSSSASYRDGVELFLDHQPQLRLLPDQRRRSEQYIHFLFEAFDSGPWDLASLYYDVNSPINAYSGSQFGNFPVGGYRRLAQAMASTSDIVVSNADVHRTFQDMIDQRHLSQKMRDRIRRYHRPHGLMAMYVGADIDLSFTRGATNIILHGRYDAQTTYDLLDRGQWDPKGWLAISSPTMKTKGVRHYGPAGHSSLEMFFPVPGDYSFWGGGDPMAGTGYKWSSVYRERKAEIEGVMMERTLRAIPELRGHVAWQESATPLSHERFTLSRMPYGPANTKDQIGPYRRLPVTTEIGGLYLAGASTAYMFGIAFTLRGGVGTASHILGRDLYQEFRKGGVLVDRSALPVHSTGWDPFEASRGHSRPSLRAAENSARRVAAA